MLVSFIPIYDLNRFFHYLTGKGIEIEEYAHTVLADSSEFEIVICKRNGVDVAYMVVHYIDAHYAALSDLRADASDREVIEALLSVDRSKLWRVPVEPVLYVAKSYEVVRILGGYVDEVPEEGRIYLDRYLSSHDNARNVIDFNSILAIANRLKDDELW